jgi:hypothetical protein
VEYLRWLQQQSWLFLRLAYTQDDIAELPDSDGDNEIVNEYDELTRHGTTRHCPTGAWPIPKLHGKYFFVLQLCTGFYNEVHNCDY